MDVSWTSIVGAMSHQNNFRTVGNEIEILDAEEDYTGERLVSHPNQSPFTNIS